MRAPGLVATLLVAMAHEHQRAAGAWQAEWETLGDLLRVAGSAASWLSDSLSRLGIDTERMGANITVEPVPDAAAELIDAVLSRRAARGVS
jgi:3-carboxy-cis,cis-muconate cycloisomerase